MYFSVSDTGILGKRNLSSPNSIIFGGIKNESKKENTFISSQLITRHKEVFRLQSMVLDVTRLIITQLTSCFHVKLGELGQSKKTSFNTYYNFLTVFKPYCTL